MTILKILLLHFFMFFSLSSFTQTMDVFKFKTEKNGSEINLYKIDSVLKIIYDVCYKLSEDYEGECCHSISLTIKDIAKFKKRKILNIEKDTSIIICDYDLMTPRDSSFQKGEISGYINLISMSSSKIKLNFNVLINSQIKYIYRGERTFNKSNTVLY